MRLSQIALSVLLVAFLLVSCAPQAVPAPAPAPQKPAPAQPAPAAAPVAKAPAKAAWELAWEKTIEAGRKEGSVAITSDGGTVVRSALVKIAAMEGIKAEVLSIKAAELLPKFTAERRAGLYLYDISMTGLYPLVAILKPSGLLERIDSALILPDVTDPELIKKVWFQGKLPWVDKDHTVLYFAAQPRLAIAINTNLVKPDEIKAWRDVLDPKWRGKIAFSDPTIAGMGQMAAFAMVGIMGESYIRELAKTEPILMRDERQLLDWLAHGKIAVVVAPQLEVLVDLIKAGAPIKGVSPSEGTWLSASTAGLTMLTKAPHPNATKVFINSLATKEGQTSLAIAGGYHSPRLDVSISHLTPDLTRMEGGEIFRYQHGRSPHDTACD